MISGPKIGGRPQFRWIFQYQRQNEDRQGHDCSCHKKLYQNEPVENSNSIPAAKEETTVATPARSERKIALVLLFRFQWQSHSQSTSLQLPSTVALTRSELLNDLQGTPFILYKEPAAFQVTGNTTLHIIMNATSLHIKQKQPKGPSWCSSQTAQEQSATID